MEGSEGPRAEGVWKPGVPQNSAVARYPLTEKDLQNPTLGRGSGWAGEGMPST